MKRILFIAIAFCAITMQAQQVPVGNKMQPDLTLQTRSVAPDSTYTYAVGDTIVVPRKIHHYLTGERIALWVYNTAHIIKQVGGERFPDGILLEGINSWVPMTKSTPLLLPNPKKTEAQKPAEQAKPAEPQKPVEQAKPAEPQKPVEEAKPAEPQKPVEEAKPAEPLQPVEEAKPAEPQKPVEETKPAEPAQTEQTQIGEKEPLRRYDRLSIGVRGGAASLMQQSVKWKIGYDALFDLQYGCYWQRGTAKPKLGFIIGLAAGYEHNDISKANVSCTDSQTAEGMTLQYTATIDNIAEHTSQIQVELPILFSMVTPKGFYFNVGPKLILPVYGMYKQQITNANVSVYVPEIDVTFTNDVVLGRFTDEQLAGRSGKIETFLYKPTVAAMLDLGYEAALKSGNALSIGVYGDYGFSFYSTAKVDPAPLVGIQAPSADANARVSLGHLSKGVTRLGFFDAGLKLTYHFNLSK